MKNTPLVSVITIFLNVEKFIQEAIESVFAQTYENWELLLADDGSSDASTDLARRYAAQHPGKVRYLCHDGHENRGMSATRNLGVRHAQGDYIAFLDADDAWLPHKLKAQVAILDSQAQAEAVYGTTEFWYSWTKEPQDAGRDVVRQPGILTNTLIKPPALLALNLKPEEATSPSMSNILLRRRLVEAVGGFDERFRGMYEDQAFLAKVYLQAGVFISGECWDRYRQHADSCCAVAKSAGQQCAARLAYLKWLETYVSHQKIKDAEVLQALKQRLKPYRLLSRGRTRVRRLLGRA